MKYTPSDIFADRHIGPAQEDVEAMLEVIGYDSLDALIAADVPETIRYSQSLDLEDPLSEAACLSRLGEMASQNKIYRSYIGMGFHACHTPSVILRNILENPQWYTPYTPYQAEIAQGRLEALLNFQTVVTELTGLDIANASLLDESTAAAEAMTLCARLQKRNENRSVFFVSDQCHPQTIEVVQTRARPLDIEILVGRHEDFACHEAVFGALLQYPETDGKVPDYAPFIEQAHATGARVVLAADLLALTLLKTPGELGADMAVGNTQRLGMPMGYGGPHAAYLATTEECRRQIPGRIVGVSRDVLDAPAYRLSLQTREQHIRRDKATSNICTAQSLPAIVASTYVVYHGPGRLTQIAVNIHLLAQTLAQLLTELGYNQKNEAYFDTLHLSGGPRTVDQIRETAETHRMNFRYREDGSIGIALDETTTLADVMDLYTAFGGDRPSYEVEDFLVDQSVALADPLTRKTPFLQQEIFNTYHSETELMRYLDRLQQKDIGLTDSMIPLGSCTMKLNAAAEMSPVTLPGFAALHPFAPVDQTFGYQKLVYDLESWLSELTGFHGISLQPNAGSQGEYAGLLAIRSYHESRQEAHRNICLIPMSAHGTNPASAVMAGMKVVGVNCDAEGNIDVDHLKQQAEQHADALAALMVTYPSTHGVFEDTIIEVCEIIHAHGGQVYLDGANLNAMVGICRPGDFGADVCHLNLHKTFCIPHGGGGPGMGPIGVAEHLVPHLPRHGHDPRRTNSGTGAVSAAPYGSGCILPISYAYILMMGEAGLAQATRAAILNANYIARRLEPHYQVLYKNKQGLIAHECIIDCRDFKTSANVEVDDIAKRLMDYGFHAPTMSWPVAGTLMIEPTESECKAELDRFCDALISIRREIMEIEDGHAHAEDNVLKNAPHTAGMVISDTWDHAYSREKAAYPAAWTRAHKYWPPVARIDNVYGDRNLVCTCVSMEELIEA